MHSQNDNQIEEWRLDHDVWVWCARCERVYRADEFTLNFGPVEQRFECPYDDCNGDYFDDGYHYAQLRLERNIDWPDAPEPGIKYKLVS